MSALPAARWSGRLRHHRGWGCWYAEDVSDCDACGAAAVPVAAYWADDGEGATDHGWRCLPCVVREHAARCGCARWRAAEAEVANG